MLGGWNLVVRTMKVQAGHIMIRVARDCGWERGAIAVRTARLRRSWPLLLYNVLLCRKVNRKEVYLYAEVYCFGGHLGSGQIYPRKVLAKI
jgi:hypothetical protein